MLSLIDFHRTLVGKASIPGDMVYLGKGEGAIASREEGAIAWGSEPGFLHKISVGGKGYLNNPISFPHTWIQNGDHLHRE